MSQEHRQFTGIDCVRFLIVGTAVMLVMAALALLIAATLTELGHRWFDSPRESAISSLAAHRLPLWSLFPSLILAYFVTSGVARTFAKRRRSRR